MVGQQEADETVRSVPVNVTITGPLATVTLDRPDRRNAISPELAEALVEALRGVDEDKDVWCVVIRGAGSHFSVGGDLAAGSGGVTTPDEEHAAAELRAAMESAYLLRTMPKPTVAAIHGACAGAGLSLACAADIRVAATSAVFNTAFVAAGVSGDYGGTWTLPRIVGDAMARELYLLSSKFDAEHALRIGLVSRVCPDDRLDDEVADITSRLISLPPLAVAGAKANLNDAATSSFADQIAIEARRHARTALSHDAAEAAAAFIGKRPAVFRGN